MPTTNFGSAWFEFAAGDAYYPANWRCCILGMPVPVLPLCGVERMIRRIPGIGLFLIAATSILGSGFARAECDASSPIRPGGGDHLLYTIERSSQNIGALQGRKFRLVVNEEGAQNLQIRPLNAFRISEVARFNGSVAFSAEVINAVALYTQESWGNLPKVLTFHVECADRPEMKSATRTRMETVPEIVPVAPQVTIPSIPDTVLPPISESSTSPEIGAYEVSSIASASLPPLPQPESSPEIQRSSRPERPPVSTVKSSAPGALGDPVAGGKISEFETRRVMVDLVPGEQQTAQGGKARLKYSLTVRNALNQSVQCDIRVESSYLGSYSSDERITVDQRVHTAIKLPARGYRSDVQGEITYYPRVLGGDRWMVQDHQNPALSGLKVTNCLPLKNAG